jgi:acyl-coenzyme A thioesterase PaaI-like protein
MPNQDRSRFLELLEQAPFSAMLGLKIESADDGSATVRMPFDLRILNEGGPTAPIHGGANGAAGE